MTKAIKNIVFIAVIAAFTSCKDDTPKNNFKRILLLYISINKRNSLKKMIFVATENIF
jgi:hypothetical protein